MPLTRQCPECGTELIYANVPGYLRAKRLNSLCRKCAASPVVVSKKLEEKENHRAAGNTGENILAGFFRMLDVQSSGSVQRN